MNKGGRPTKYDYVKFESLLDEYIGKCIDKYRKILTYKRVDSKGGIHCKYDYKLEANIPTVSGYAHYIGISRETIYAWRKQYDDFNILIEHLQGTQIVKLVNGGISKRYNSSICCLRLRRLGIGSHRTF